jgi:hypothetical protein
MACISPVDFPADEDGHHKPACARCGVPQGQVSLARSTRGAGRLVCASPSGCRKRRERRERQRR